MQYVKRSLSTEPDRLTLAALTHLLSQEPMVTAIQLVETLAERRVTLTPPKLTESLRRLVEHDIVREIAGEPPRYEVIVGLVRLRIE